MRKKAGKCGMLLLVLALAVGIFCVFQNWRSDNFSKNGTGVKNVCDELGRKL